MSRSGRGIGGGAVGVLAVALCVTGCLNHFQIHPRRAPETVATARQTVDRGHLRLQLEWAHPAAAGAGARLPAVLVHPEARHRAREMRGILHSLAERGYLALAVDYQRKVGRGYRRRVFAWQSKQDSATALDVLLEHPLADPERVAVMGYSQGGVFSLLIAAYTQRVDAVVAYYPLTDFARWLLEPEGNALRRFAFRVVRWHIRRSTGARSRQELEEFLRRASPLHQAAEIRAPVLLIHGARDTTAGPEESVRLKERLEELGREVELLVIEDAGHVFNFKSPAQAAVAWEAATAWIDRHLEKGARTEPVAGATGGDAPPGARDAARHQ